MNTWERLENLIYSEPDSSTTYERLVMTTFKDAATKSVASKKDIYEVARLSRLYSEIPTKAIDIENLSLTDQWLGSELLTDMVSNPKEKTEQRECVAAYIAIRKPKEKIGEDISYTCVVKTFACVHFYDIEVAAAWTHYRLGCMFKDNPEIVETYWFVDENDLPLQLVLHDLGYVAKSVCNYTLKQKNKKDYVSSDKILFVI